MSQEQEDKPKVTVMDFQKLMEYASTPQAEPRIGSLDSLNIMLSQMKRSEDRDKRPTKEGQQNSMFISLGSS
jgi:hypothetical protein